MTDIETIREARKAIALVERAQCAKPSNFAYRTVKAFLAKLDRLAARVGKLERKEALIEAVMSWCGDSEGSPGNPSDARLMKAIWTYEGDRTMPCDECDGECGEPCAPCTVAQAHASLDQFIAAWNKKRGVEPLPPPRRLPMTNAERARKVAAAMHAVSGPWQDAKPRREAILAAAFDEVAREMLEMAANVLPAGGSYQVSNWQSGYEAGVKAKYDAIRALIPDPASPTTHSASCNISEKLSDVCSCGAEPDRLDDERRKGE